MSHIVCEGTTLHFRYRIPHQFQAVLRQRVLKMSLKTGNKRLANQRAERLITAARTFFTQLHDTDMTDITSADLKIKLRAFLEQSLYEDEGKRATPPLPLHPQCPGGPIKKNHEASELEMFIDEVKAGLHHADYSFFITYVDRFVEQSGLEVEENTPEYYRIARGVYEMMFDLLNIKLCRATSDILGEREYMEKLPPLPQSFVREPSTSVSQVVPVPSKPSPSLKEVVKKFIDDKKKSDWGTASIKDIPPQLIRFRDFVGPDIHIDELNRDHMRHFRDTITRIPNGNHVAKYKGKSLEELVTMNIPVAHRLKTSTVENNYNNIKSFLNWCVDEEYIQQVNPLKSVLKLGKQAAKASTPKRRAFTVDELQTLFESQDYKRGKFGCAAKFWAPIIALFSGARIEEICQLYLDDIREIDGVMCFDINAEDDKDIKTAAGKRVVPVHPFLIEIGLLDRIEHLRAKGEQHLFHRRTLSQAGGKLSTNISKAFTYYRRKYGVGGDTDESSEVVFHSFRHNVISMAKHKRIDRRLVKEVVGHEDGEFHDVTGGYEALEPPKVRHDEFISQIDYHKILDLDHLKGSMWITKR